MKKLMISLAALCAISTGTIAAETPIQVKAASETNIKIKIPGQGIAPKESSSTNYEQCTPWPENPWDIRCPF